MPALLRIFTRVNLFAFVGEDQGKAVDIISLHSMGLMTESTPQPTASMSTTTSWAFSGLAPKLFRF